jgi:hypothetical protein
MGKARLHDMIWGDLLHTIMSFACVAIHEDWKAGCQPAKYRKVEILKAAWTQKTFHRARTRRDVRFRSSLK